MKIKRAIILGMVGLIMVMVNLRIIFVIPGFNEMFHGIAKHTSMFNAMKNIVGNIFILVFFYVYFTRQQVNKVFRNVGILGVIGIGLRIILIITGFILTQFFRLAVEAQHRNIKTIQMLSTSAQVNNFINIFSVIILIICLSIYYFNLSKEDKIRNYVLLALSGQYLILVLFITSFTFLPLIIQRIYNVFGNRGIQFVINVQFILGLIPSILLLCYFIKLYTIHRVEKTEEVIYEK